MSSSHHLTFLVRLVLTAAILEEIHQKADDSLLKDSIFDELGDLHQSMAQHFDVFWDSSPAEIWYHIFHAHLHENNPPEEDWKSLRPYFGWQSD